MWVALECGEQSLESTGFYFTFFLPTILEMKSIVDGSSTSSFV
jgi:hypothetical protein